MSLTLHYHPLSSFCHKVLFALYENGTPFETAVVNLQDREGSAGFFKSWPIGKMPVLADSAGETLPESTIILEYLDRRYPGPVKLFPGDPELCLQARLWDRILDSYIHVQMQKVVSDIRRPEGEHDDRGVAEAKAMIAKAYDLLEAHLENREFLVGPTLTVADCAAVPALFYGGIVEPFGDERPLLSAYFDRLFERPSFQRLLREARPFFKYFPLHSQMPGRFVHE